MTLHDDMKRPWWREPMVWLIAGLPLTAVIAGLTTVWIASHNADTLVKEGYSKDGFTVLETLEVDRVAARLGVVASLRVEGGAITARLTGTTQAPGRLTLTFAHPTEATMDVEATLEAAGDGLYQAELPPLPDGRRLVILESKEQGWRLRAPWQAPISGQLEMVAGKAGS